MKKAVLIQIGLLTIFSGWVSAQNVPPPPAPVVENDLRDNTIKMRSIDLERVKRDANKIRPDRLTKAEEIRFAKTKENFERIQKLQDSIVKAYTTGKTINYGKIASAASKITQKSRWLDENLFGATPEQALEAKKAGSRKRKSVRDLIIELDNAIGNFISSPIFQNTKVVDPEIAREAQSELEEIIGISTLLALEAEQLK